MDPQWGGGYWSGTWGCSGGILLRRGDASENPDMAVVIGVVDPGWDTFRVGLETVDDPPGCVPLGVPVRVLTGLCGVDGLDTVVGKTSCPWAGAF